MLLGTRADVYFTGEMSHHEVLAAIATGHNVVLCKFPPLLPPSFFPLRSVPSFPVPSFPSYPPPLKRDLHRREGPTPPTPHTTHHTPHRTLLQISSRIIVFFFHSFSLLGGHTNTERGYLPTLSQKIKSLLEEEASIADPEVATALRTLEVHISQEDRHPLQIV